MSRSPFLNASSELDPATFDALRRLIYEYCGIHFEDNKRYLLESRVHQRMRANRIREYKDYLKLIATGGADGELPVLVNSVTINETFFFRHSSQLELITRRLLPDIIRRKTAIGPPRVRIWSAGCSSGDEPYTLAILAREAIQPAFPRAIIEIVATDIDSTILATARRAIYSDYAVRNVPPPLLERYFREEAGRFVLDRSIRDMVRFKQMNLADATAMRSMLGFDMILCANVLIYFDAAAKRRVLELLYQSLQPDGFLLIGFSETLYGITERFVPVHHERSLVYQRADAAAIARPMNLGVQPLDPVSNLKS